MRARFCDDLPFGFSWIVDEPATRTAHALATDAGVWLVDPVDWPEAIDRALAIGPAAGVLQLLDRHNRDCATVARRLGIPHLVVPEAIPGSPFQVIGVRASRSWREVALWWPAAETLVVAEAIGTNASYAPQHGAGVHLLRRLTPPRAALGAFRPEHLLVGHGEGVHGDAAARSLAAALDASRRGLPRAVASLPALAADAVRRRRG